MADLAFLTLREPPARPARRAVLMLLHGVGSNERNMAAVAAGSDPALGVISVRSPLQVGPDAYAWFRVSFTTAGPAMDPDEAEAARQVLLGFIAWYRAAHEIDDVYLMGFSQGSIMAVVAAVTAPSEIQGAVGFSGRFPKEFLPRVVSPAALARTALWVGHGTEDQVLPVQHGRATRSLLEQVEAPFHYGEYAAGHSVTPQMQEDAHAWLSRRVASVAG